jgi:rubredoxin
MIKHDRVDPTYTKEGTEEYWECTECNLLFDDAEGENRIGGPTKIERLSEQESISEAKISKIPDLVYTGESLKPEFTITCDGRILTEGKDYAVKWKNNKKPGKATITITGKSDFIGTKTTSFNILPKSVKLSSLKAGKKSLTVKWKKLSDISGYQIRYSTKKDYSSGVKRKQSSQRKRLL